MDEYPQKSENKTKKVIEFIALDNQPISVGQNAGFAVSWIFVLYFRLNSKVCDNMWG